MTLPLVPAGEISHATRDGQPVVMLRCPGCGHWGDIDDDQLLGRVSVNHDNCGCGCTFHETRNWQETATVVDAP